MRKESIYYDSQSAERLLELCILCWYFIVVEAAVPDKKGLVASNM